MLDISELLHRIERAVEKFMQRGPHELEQQGHVATKNLIYSFELDMSQEDLNRISARILTLDYGLDVDTGTPAFEIRKKGRRHLQDLLDWIAVIQPNLRPKERLSFANRANIAHQREGVPTKASVRFSKNGRRTGWIKHAYEDQKAQDQLERDLQILEVIAEGFEEAAVQASRQP